MSDHLWQMVPAPSRDAATGLYSPKWTEVLLFCNLTPADSVAGYSNTTTDAVRDLLDEGPGRRANPTSSVLVCNYWGRLSYGKFGFGLDTPRASPGGVPLIPLVTIAPGGETDYTAITGQCLVAEAEAIWLAAGSQLTDSRDRFIPSITLIQNYTVAPPSEATTGAPLLTQTVGDHKYVVGRLAHMPYDASFVATSDTVPSPFMARSFIGTLCHENGHNFLEFADLYGPTGCTGYWDLLGSNLEAGIMSEVSAVQKERVGWLAFSPDHVIQGVTEAPVKITLRPYTETGDACKIVPDLANNPLEYFVLEFRKSTGTQVFQPDGALRDSGLLITHINTRLPHYDETWLVREAPYFHPERADFSDHGGTVWTGLTDRNGFVYPGPTGTNAFTDVSEPNSDFYGRPSGLKLTDITVGEAEVSCKVEVTAPSVVAWPVSARDQGISGRFTDEALTHGRDQASGEEIFFRNDSAAALLVHRKAQWFARVVQNDRIGAWALGGADRIAAADLDGDFLDEVLLRSDRWAAVAKWTAGKFDTLTIQADAIGAWTLEAGQSEVLGDFDGDGRAEICLRSSTRLGVAKLQDGRELALASMQDGRIGEWALGGGDHQWRGQFTRTDRDQILVRSDAWIGVFDWDPDATAMRCVGLQNATPGWTLSTFDRHVIADIDGDGKDEVYIRSDTAAGILKHDGTQFNLMWSGNLAPTIALTGSDSSYGGRFRPDRDGILHLTSDLAAILTWDDGKKQMSVRQETQSPLSALWNLGDADQIILGRFERIGPDVGDPTGRYIADGLTGAFVHSADGTAMLGVNVLPGREQMGLSWCNKGPLLYDHLAPVVAAAEPPPAHANLPCELLDQQIGDAGDALAAAIDGSPPASPAAIAALTHTLTQLRATYARECAPPHRPRRGPVDATRIVGLPTVTRGGG